MRKTFFLVFFLLLNLSPLYAQIHARKDTVTVRGAEKTADPNEIILKYEDILSKENDKHREYTKDYYDMLLKVLTSLSVLAIGVFAWLNWKTKKDIQESVNERFQNSFEGLLNQKLGDMDNVIESHKEKSMQEFGEIRKLFLELTELRQSAVTIRKGTMREERVDADRLRGKTILWVDDHPKNNEYPRSILEQAGVTFELRTDTNLAMDYLKSKRVDLIISDMGRGPNMRAGLDLLNKVKNLHIKIPIIIYASSSTVKKNGDEALDLGAFGVTSRQADLLNMIQKVLSET